MTGCHLEGWLLNVPHLFVSLFNLNTETKITRKVSNMKKRPKRRNLEKTEYVGSRRKLKNIKKELSPQREKPRYETRPECNNNDNEKKSKNYITFPHPTTFRESILCDSPYSKQAGTCINSFNLQNNRR